MKRICIFLMMLLIGTTLFAFSDVQLELAHNQEFALYQRLQLDTVIARKSSNNKATLSELKLRDLVPTMNASSKNYYMEFNDSIGGLELLQIQRDRLEYVYERNQKSALRALVPNALSIATMAITAGNPLKSIISIVGAAASSAVSYLDAKDQANLSYLQQTWELDDQEMNILLELGNDIYEYKCDIASELDIPTAMTLSREDMEAFVDFCNETDARKRSVKLATLDKRLEILPDYWRELALTAYELEDYEQTLKYIAMFEEIYYPVIYHDSDYAHLLMVKSDCINQLDIENKYEELEKIATLLLNHISAKDWKSRFYVLSLYLEIYRSTGEEEILEKAFDLFPTVLIEIFAEYEEDLESYINRNYVNQGLSEIETDIESAEAKVQSATQNLANAKKNDFEKKGDAYKNLEEKKTKAEEELRELKEAKDKFKRTGDLMLPPSLEFICSMMTQYEEMAIKLDRARDFEYRIICDDFWDIVSQNAILYHEYLNEFGVGDNNNSYSYTNVVYKGQDANISDYLVAGGVTLGATVVPVVAIPASYLWYKAISTTVKNDKKDIISIQIPLSYIYTTQDGSEALFDNDEIKVELTIKGMDDVPIVFDLETHDVSVEVTESLDSSRLVIEVDNMKKYDLGIKSPEDKNNLSNTYTFLISSENEYFEPLTVSFDSSHGIAQMIEKNFGYTDNFFTIAWRNVINFFKNIGTGISGIFTRKGNK